MRIGLDMDEVLVAFCRGYNAIAYEVAGYKVLPDDYEPTKYSYMEDFYPAETVEKMCTRIHGSSSWWFALEPLQPNFDDYFAWHGEFGAKHDIYYVTNRTGKFAKWQTEHWLRKRGINHPTVLLSKYKGLVAKVLRLEAYVDDKLENVQEVRAVCGDGIKLYLPSRKYNQDDTVPVYTRIERLSEMLEELQCS